MINYYKGNKFYDYIYENNIPNYFYLKENRWLLIYGNEKCEAKLIIYLAALSDKEFYNKEISKEDIQKYQIAKQLSKRTLTPCIYVGFQQNIEELSYVKVKYNEQIEYLNTKQLRKLYTRFGLPMADSISAKKINKQYSNAYQKWQLLNGYGLVASDIDLIKFDNNIIISAYELKRSKISLTNWKPYTVDYHNFQILSNLFSKANIKFYIVYNHRQEYPFNDDISQLKIFNVNNNKEPLCEFNEYINIKDFFKKY